MSTHTYPFAVLRVQPDPVRGESFNIGLVVFVDGKVIASIDENSMRLRALDPDLAALPIWATLQQDIEGLTNGLASVDTQHYLLKSMLAPVYADQKLGEITIGDGESIEDRIEQLMQRLIRRPQRTVHGSRSTRDGRESKLNLYLRDWFKRANIYSRKVTDISNHRVVSGYPIVANNDLYAEFALKNGVVHIIETLDFRGHEKVNATVHKEAALKSIVLDQARHTLDQGSKRIAVIAASDYSAMRPAIGIVTKYADDVIAMSSSQDKQRLADFIAMSLRTQTVLPTLQ